MTTPPQTAEIIADSAPPASAAPANIALWLKNNVSWLWLLIPYIFACWIPVLWAWEWWGNPRSPVLLQPFVPFLAMALAWSRREEIGAAVRRSKEGTRRNFWVRGNLVPLAIGCFGLLFSHIIHVKGIAIFSLWLIGIGAIYNMYGLMVLKAAWIPIAFSLLVVPPPDGVLVALTGRSLQGISFVTRTLLGLVTTTSVDPRGFLRLDKWGYSVEFRESMAPTIVVLPALTLGLWYVLYHRLPWKKAVTFLISISGIAILVCLLQAILVALVTGQKREIGDLIQVQHPITPMNLFDPTGFVQAIVMLAVAWGGLFLSYGGALMLTQQNVATADRLARPTGAVANRLGRGIGVIFSPLVALLDGIGKMGKVFKRMERGIEGMLAKVFRKKKNRGW